MKRVAKWCFLFVALAALALSLFNASWIAPTPEGKLLLIAHNGVTQPPPEGGDSGGDCPGTNIGVSEHTYLENSVNGIRRATMIGADAIAVPVQRTKDGRLVMFRDATLDCRTNASGPIAERSLGELKRVDAGYRYTNDGGKTFPLRGRIGAIEPVEDMLPYVQGRRLIFTFGSDDPAEADALAAAFRRAHTAIDDKVGFIGPQAVTGRMRELAPESWTFSAERSQACLDRYFKVGWAGMMPEECRHTTVAVTLADGWKIWGWPYRFLDRMAGADTKVMLAASLDAAGNPVGLSDPQQLGEVPRAYHGYLWVENMYDVGRALQ